MKSESSWLTRRTLRWALYDVASSTYAALVPVLFGLYFVKAMGPAGAKAGALWGLIAATTLVLAGLVAPVAGALADRTGRWHTALALMTATCVGATLLLPAATAVHATLAGLAFIVAQLGYTLATNLYDSLVVEVAPASRRGSVSGLGWALGLSGGTVAVLVALLLVQGVPPPEQVDRLGAVFVATGVLYGVIAVPGVLALRGLRPAPNLASREPGALSASLGKVKETLRDWRSHRPTLRVLVSFFLINDVMVTIQFFIAIVISARFATSVEGLLKLSLLFHVIAIPSTLVIGTLADRWGGTRAIAAMSTVLALSIALLAFGEAPWVPAACMVMFGLVFGSMQAVFRSLYASLVASDRAAEFFGFNTLAGRMAAATGPLIFGGATALFGTSTAALCLLLAPLAAGVALLVTTRFPAKLANTSLASGRAV